MSSLSTVTKNTASKFPLTCGESYIGQTGRCVNVRLKEHERSLKSENKTDLPLASHCDECKCRALFSRAKTLGTWPQQITRELVESHMIHNENAVSHPSIKPTNEEIKRLDQMRLKFGARNIWEYYGTLFENMLECLTDFHMGYAPKNTLFGLCVLRSENKFVLLLSFFWASV